MRRGKTVLVVDDFCTEGNSFEAARAFIEATGARTIALSWLKTISKDFREICGRFPIGNPYAPINVKQEPPTKSHWYTNAIIECGVMTDLAEVYSRYYKWDWP
jgi:hypoxanthine phosphoribosyltransferase